MTSDDPLDTELESFRKQWLSDLQSQREPPSPIHHHHQSRGRQHAASQQSFSSSSTRPGPSQNANGPPSPTAARRALILDEGTDYLGGRSFDEPAPPLTIPSETRTLDASENSKEKKLVSALDYYEEATEKESQGNMGDSLQLYRKAYKVRQHLSFICESQQYTNKKQMDHGVERRYREKHFPAAASKAPAVQAQVTAPIPASSADPEPVPLKTFSELLSSFAALQIDPAVPDVEGEPALPCPIANLPDELLTHILHDVAVADIAEYVRLSLVCKRLAYLVASEQRIWRRVCIGPEFGFAGMHYRWNTGIEWGPLSSSDSEDGDDEQDEGDEGSTAIVSDFDAERRLLSPRERAQRRQDREYAMTLSLTPSAYPTWKKMFRNRPRIRFDGCYISTVNYVRSGQASTNQLTWGGAPILLVTYYRYLRFFRDGSLISLLASDPPADVVHYMTRDAVRLHRDAASQHHHLPGAVMRLAHRGRWKLSPPGHGAVVGTGGGGRGRGAAPSGDDELAVETEGVGSKYVFKMDLQVRSAGKSTASRNNKLVLYGFYSYNKLTEDWAEFVLKNNKPFFFSRVRSYGLGD
ncbi:hypothetical protein MY4038_005884 [Beauveria bassiana]